MTRSGGSGAAGLSLAVAGLLVACATSRPALEPTAVANAVAASAPTGGHGFPQHAADWWRAVRASADGRVRPGGRARALAVLAASRQPATARQAAEGASNTPRIDWRPHGPFDIGGRVRMVVVHPDDPDTLWAAAATGGVWKSTNGGASWRPLTDHLPVLEANALALDPSDPNTIYLGTGEGAFWLTASQPTILGTHAPGLGIWRSRDGGGTWQPLPATSSWRWVNRILISPVDSNELLVAGEGGVWRSRDGGVSFQRSLAAATAWSLVADPSNHRRLLATVVDCSLPCSGYDVAAGHRAVRSVDGGFNWSTSHQEPGPSQGRLELAFAPSDPSRAYLLRDRALTHSGGVGWRRVFRSTDGGASFAPRQSDLDQFGASSYMATIWVAPDDPELIFVGGRDLARSLDGGRTFTTLTPDDPNLFHGDQHWFALAGDDPDALLIANDGGVYRLGGLSNPSPGGGAERWTRLTRGLAITQAYAACGGAFPYQPAGLPSASYWLLAGTQDWSSIGLGLPAATETTFDVPGIGGGTRLRDGSSCVHDSLAQVTYHAAAGLAQLARFPAGSFTTASGTPVAPVRGQPCPWRPALALDHPAAGVRRLYVACNGLWRTDQALADEALWQRIFVAGIGAADVGAIAPDPADPNRLWIGLGDGRLYRSDNVTEATPSWQTLDDNLAVDPLPNRWITSLLVDHTTPGLVYAGFGGYEDNLFVSLDNGASWNPLGAATSDAGGSDLAAGLPPAPLYDLIQHPVEPGWLFAASDVGIFASFDGGVTWEPEDSGPLAVTVTDLEFLPGTSTLLAATYGRGLWTAELPAPCVPSATTSCLGANGRFRVEARFQTAGGDRGTGRAVPLAADTSWFWFFGADNLELIVKVLDGCAVNDRFWVFAAGLTSVETTLTVSDTVSGAVRKFRNPQNRPYQPVQDTTSLAVCQPIVGQQGARAPARVRART